MKKSISIFTYLTFTLVITTIFNCYGQTPDWISYEKRMSKYPAASYLTGYTTAVDVKFDETLKQSLISTAKINLMESINVSIESSATLQIATENGETNTTYLNKTNSKSTVNIVGLQSETYYDKKQKTAYAFVYALTSKVIAHYRELIKVTSNKTENSLSACQSFLASDDITNALDKLLITKDQLIIIREAQGNLLALGVKDAASLKIDEINTLDKKSRDLQNLVLNNTGFSVVNLSRFLTYKMNQILAVDETIHIKKILFEDYTLNSPFGSDLEKYLSEDLLRLTYKLSDTKAESTYYIVSTYTDRDGLISVTLRVINKRTKEVLSTVNGNMSIGYFNGKMYAPELIHKVRILSTAKLTPSTKVTQANFNKPLTNPIGLKITNDKGQPLAGIPCMYSHKSSPNVKGEGISDAAGMLILPIEKIASPKKMQFIQIQLNAEKYLGVKNSDPLYGALTSKYKLPQANLKLKITGTSLYVESTETLLGEPYQQNLVSNKIKQSLTELGFSIVNDIDNADFLMEITVGSSIGGQYQSLYFSLANVTVNLTDMENGDEVYSQTFLKIKEGGSNHKAAAIKAYNKAAEKVSVEIKTEFQ